MPRDQPISFHKTDRGHALTTGQWVRRPLDEVFAFFADAHNLQRITPPWVGFRILTPQPIAMAAGTLIEYRIRLFGVPIRWKTEIEAWEPGARFVDRQLRGPYTLWVHEHRFEEREGGVWCSDRVDYTHWGGPIGERVFIQPSLRRIFEYRHRAIRQIFA